MEKSMTILCAIFAVFMGASFAGEVTVDETCSASLPRSPATEASLVQRSFQALSNSKSPEPLSLLPTETAVASLSKSQRPIKVGGGVGATIAIHAARLGVGKVLAFILAIPTLVCLPLVLLACFCCPRWRPHSSDHARKEHLEAQASQTPDASSSAGTCPAGSEPGTASAQSVTHIPTMESIDLITASKDTEEAKEEHKAATTGSSTILKDASARSSTEAYMGTIPEGRESGTTACTSPASMGTTLEAPEGAISSSTAPGGSTDPGAEAADAGSDQVQDDTTPPDGRSPQDC